MMRRRWVAPVGWAGALAVVVAVSVVSTSQLSVATSADSSLLVGNILRGDDVGDQRTEAGVLEKANGCVVFRAESTGVSAPLLAPGGYTLSDAGIVSAAGAVLPFGERIILIGGEAPFADEAYPDGTPDGCREGSVFAFWNTLAAS
jgi:hypothetical protein